MGVDTNGDGDGLINVHTGLLGDTLSGTNIDVITDNSIADAHVPGLLDATVGEGGLGQLVGGLGGLDGTGDGIHIEALNGENLLEVHAPPLLDATVGGSEVGNLTGGLSGVVNGLLGGAGGGEGHGIQVEAANGEHLLEVHAPPLLDATVGGAELGNLLDGVLGGGDGGLLGNLLDVGHGDLLGGLDLAQVVEQVDG